MVNVSRGSSGRATVPITVTLFISNLQVFSWFFSFVIDDNKYIQKQLRKDEEGDLIYQLKKYT